jgi:hypothetical protein
MQEQKIEKILIQLEESVDRDTRKKLNEDLLHLAIDTWEAIEHQSHAWHMSKGEMLKLVGVALFGAAIMRYSDLKTIWKKLTKINLGKARKLLQATRIINSAQTSTQAAELISQKLGIEVPLDKI